MRSANPTCEKSGEQLFLKFKNEITGLRLVISFFYWESIVNFLPVILRNRE